ncbi:MAG: beta-cystathionase, partial [Lacrimispora sp.]
WIDMSRAGGDSDAIQNALVHVGKVGIMQGKAYGDENYLRMNLGCPRGKLVEGLERMKRALEKLSSINAV